MVPKPRSEDAGFELRSGMLRVTVGVASAGSNRSVAGLEPLWSGFCCPDCRGLLEASSSTCEQGELRCTSCSASYRVTRGIAGLIGKMSALNQGEVETQDRVS